jgi:hypothetical protein
MSDEYTETVHAETAACEFRKAWLEVLANWRGVEGDPLLMADLYEIHSGLSRKLSERRSSNAA